MLKILALPWVILQRLFALAFPMVRGQPGGSAGVWVARLLLLSAVLGLLTLVNEILGLKVWISSGRISRYWLPLMAFCLYATGKSSEAMPLLIQQIPQRPVIVNFPIKHQH